MPPYKTPRPKPPEDGDSTQSALETIKQLTPLMAHQAAKADSYKKDKNAIINWVAGILGSAALGWGIWVTNYLSDLRAANVSEDEKIMAGVERDKQLAEAAMERAASIQVQLAQIQTQLAEIQRELRHRDNGR